MKEPFEKCPVLETSSFILRLVSENDAEDLLSCYSDPKSQRVFDSENLINSLYFETVDQMADCIRFWLNEYNQKIYVRFAVVDKKIQKPVGTVEMFNAKGFLDDFEDGILRIDLASRYETTAYITELLELAREHFYDLFGVNMIVAKGRPAETNRVGALIAAGYEPYNWHNPNREHYYYKKRG